MQKTTKTLGSLHMSAISKVLGLCAGVAPKMGPLSEGGIALLFSCTVWARHAPRVSLEFKGLLRHSFTHCFAERMNNTLTAFSGFLSWTCSNNLDRITRIPLEFVSCCAMCCCHSLIYGAMPAMHYQHL